MKKHLLIALLGISCSTFAFSAHLKIGDADYSGAVKNHQPHGKGELVWKDTGEYYKGQFVQGKYEGKGELLNDAHFYKGQFKNGLYEGKGTLLFTNAKNIADADNVLVQEYQGEFKQGHATGKGKLIYTNGQVYRGEVVEAQAHGQGKLFDKAGKLIFSGQFVENKAQK